MISIQQIHTADKEHYCFVENLFTTAFPKEERREISLQREYTDHKKHFHNNIILIDEVPVGFIVYWKFDSFFYVEHFAIDATKRDGGYGQKALDALKEQLKSPIVLEVEQPRDEISERRIRFYQRQGYQLWKNEYQQPPYRKKDNYLPMQLMVHGELDCDSDFELIKTTLYKEVYQVEN
ncbi:GNAT family N-acetyltransferase [uncultured Bacteroides sp.]|uniref:GNAT family N-acetyltransferase n=1 Tax=uncultured Bacteroides sp. TaxID=162156 RepID=UPI002AAAB4E6|nr:GNAT family N-acetyltransferase [uncultured Bacteroides sp.]